MRLRATLFISFASEDRELAKGIALGLRNHKYNVFLDESDLPVGQEYDQRIKSAIKKSDGMIFIASKYSLLPGRYTLTELRFAEETWPAPIGKILPVLIGGVNIKKLPAYLQAVTVLNIKGNAKAESLSEARKIWPIINGKKLFKYIIYFIAFVIVFLIALKRLQPPDSKPPTTNDQSTIQKAIDAGKDIHNKYCAKCHDDEISILDSLGNDISDYVKYDRIVEDRFIDLFNKQVQMPKKELKTHKKLLDEKGIEGVYVLLKYYKYKSEKKKDDKDKKLEELRRFYESHE